MHRVLPLSLALALVFGAPAAAQVRVVSLDELKSALAPGDIVSIVSGSEEPITGKVLQVDAEGLRVDSDTESSGSLGRRIVDVPYSWIRSLDRPRDPTGNGAAIGAAVGAGIGATLFALAYAGDANEVGEWSGAYIAVAGILAGGGALIGWGIDRAHSKPPLRFEGGSSASTTMSVSPFVGRRRGVRVRFSF